MDAKLLALYFLIGGTVVALATYFGHQGKGLLTAFIAIFPSITVVTLSTIYLRSGLGAAASYSRGLLALMPAWFVYIICVFFLLPRLGFAPALIIGVSLYSVIGIVIMRLTP